jgi:hypothetical protein
VGQDQLTVVCVMCRSLLYLYISEVVVQVGYSSSFLAFTIWLSFTVSTQICSCIAFKSLLVFGIGLVIGFASVLIIQLE